MNYRFSVLFQGQSAYTDVLLFKRENEEEAIKLLTVVAHSMLDEEVRTHKFILSSTDIEELWINFDMLRRNSVSWKVEKF